MARHDVAIYAPWARDYYDRAAPVGGGGAERQTVLLARSLARRGLRVAHIVHAVEEPIQDPDAPVTLIQRPKPSSHGSARDLAIKSRDVWSSLSEADASVQVFRGANAVLGIGGAWTRAHRRRLVFAGANNSDFTGEGAAGSGARGRLFAAGVRVTDAVVVQSVDQQRHARGYFPGLEPLQLNSFVEPAAPAGPAEAFLWVSRLVDYKRPMLYADLAAAVPEAQFWLIPTTTDNAAFEPLLQALHRRSAELPNLQLLDQRPHAGLQELIGRAVAMVNTSSFEGMPNTWLEGWARGVPALTYSFDPDRRVADHGLGVSAGGDWDAFVAGTRRLWAERGDRGGLSDRVREYVLDAHGTQVEEGWEQLIRRLSDG